MSRVLTRNETVIYLRSSVISPHERMKLLDSETTSAYRLAASELSMMKSQTSKLNIRLKTHSLSRLNIPLETSIGFDTRSSSHPPENRQSAVIGSVDFSSDLHPQSLSDHRWSMEQPCANVSQRRARRTNSFINSTVVKDSMVRLRRVSQAQNHHRSSLQTVDRACESKGRPSSIRKSTGCSL